MNLISIGIILLRKPVFRVIVRNERIIKTGLVGVFGSRERGDCKPAEIVSIVYLYTIYMSRGGAAERNSNAKV
jgi:hypothetical protein